MIIVTRKYVEFNVNKKEYRVFKDDEVKRLQEYLDSNDGDYTFQKL